jgi:hypothetical protein
MIIRAAGCEAATPHMGPAEHRRCAVAGLRDCPRGGRPVHLQRHADHDEQSRLGSRSPRAHTRRQALAPSGASESLDMPAWALVRVGRTPRFPKGVAAHRVGSAVGCHARLRTRSSRSTVSVPCVWGVGRPFARRARTRCRRIIPRVRYSGPPSMPSFSSAKSSPVNAVWWSPGSITAVRLLDVEVILHTPLTSVWP